MKRGRAFYRRSNHIYRPTCVVPLEIRDLLAAVSVDVSQVVRTVNTALLGVNTVWWDTSLNTSETAQMVEAAGLNLFRLPGGSSADDFHFNAAPSYQGEGTIPSMASFVASVNGQAVVTLDYGSGSPQEAAAELAYLNAPVGATTPIGDGPEWNDTTSAWQTVNWQTAGYWASLRAAQPLPVDDGLNFLRLGARLRSTSTISRLATRNMEAGRSTTTRRSTTRPPMSLSPSNLKHTLRRSTRRF